VGKFDGKDKMSGTFSTDSYNGTWSATRTGTTTAAPLPGTLSEKRTDR